MRAIHVTFASELLRAALDARGAKARLAELLEVRLELIGRWSRGERRMSPPTRFKIQDLLGIDARLWDEPVVKKPPPGVAVFVEESRRRVNAYLARGEVAASAVTFRGDRVA